MKKTTLGAAAVSLGLLAVPTAIRRLDHARSGDGGEGSRCSAGKEVLGGVVSRDGTRLYAEFCGEPGPTVFFAHGWTCRHDVFRHQMSFLCKDYRVISMDQRGHGKSGAPASGDHSIDRLAEDLKAVIDAAGPEEFVIVGHSMGGFTAFKFHQRFGDEYRGRLKGMVMIDSTGTDVLESIYMSGVVRRFYPLPLSPFLVLGGRRNRLVEWGREVLRDSSAAYLICRWAAFGAKPPAEAVEMQREMSFSTPVPTTCLAAKACFDYHVEEHLPHVNVPVIMFVGTKDKLTSAKANRRTCDLLPDARLVVYEGAGHSTHLERTDELNAEMGTFIATCFGRTPKGSEE
ncbi:MAG: alpha/beta hydrolase [Actinomycetota bacterium]